VSEGYFPESESPLRAQLPVVNERFAEFREALLLEHPLATARAYWGDLEDFVYWCAAEGVDVLDPEPAEVRRYLDQLRANEYSPNTIRRRLTTLGAFYRQLVERGELARSPVDERDAYAAHSKHAWSDLDERRRERLLQAAAVGGRRDIALVHLLLDGLTVTQLCRARVEDLQEREGQTVLLVRERGTERTLRLSRATTMALAAYLGDRSSGPLLLDRQGRAMDRFDVRRSVRRLAHRTRRGQELSLT